MALYIRSGNMEKCHIVSKKAVSDFMYYIGRGIKLAERQLQTSVRTAILTAEQAVDFTERKRG